MSEKIGILWGGGLGDLLVIRPFLLALHADSSVESYLLTTAAHSTELFEEFCSPTRVIQLPHQYSRLLSIVRKWRHVFDLIYLGPYPTFKTRLLGYLLSPGKLWSRAHKNIEPYILDQIIADIAELGLSTELKDKKPAVFLPWPAINQNNPFPEGSSFLVIHPGAKKKWTTTLWPIERWKTLIVTVLKETDYSLCILGVKEEEASLDSIITSLPDSLKSRVKLCVAQPLQNVAELILGSGGVICHNSGILHLSTLLQKKTLCITGSSGIYWQPHYPWVKNLTSGLCTFACNCYKCPVPFSRAKCINSIETGAVWKEVINHFNIGK